MQLPFPGDAAPLGIRRVKIVSDMNIWAPAEHRGAKFMLRLKALRALPAERLVNALNMATMNTPTYAGPMLDGQIAACGARQRFCPTGGAAKGNAFEGNDLASDTPL